MNGFHKPTVGAVAVLVLVGIVTFWILSKRRTAQASS